LVDQGLVWNRIGFQVGLKMESLKKWRKFFSSAGTDICDVIEYAILVAASDCPNEFRRKRDRIAQKLYASTFAIVSLPEPHDKIIDDQDAGIKGFHDKDNEKLNSSIGETDGNRLGNYRCDEAKSLTEEIGEESQVLREVFRIIDILGSPNEVVFLLI
jgi:hypothetical protein